MFPIEMTVKACKATDMEFTYRLPLHVNECVRHMAEALHWLSDTERARIMGGNLCELLRWRPAERAKQSAAIEAAG